VKKGLPQGAVLSPILYDVYTSEIHLDLPNEVRIIQFADDVAIYACGLDRQRNKNLIREAVNILANNLDSIGLTLDLKKSHLIEFNKGGFVDENMQIELRNEIIENKAAARFLGIIIDNQLKFEEHISLIKRQNGEGK